MDGLYTHKAPAVVPERTSLWTSLSVTRVQRYAIPPMEMKMSMKLKMMCALFLGFGFGATAGAIQKPPPDTCVQTCLHQYCLATHQIGQCIYPAQVLGACQVQCN